MPEGIVDQIKSSVMQKVMSSFTGEAAKNGDKGGYGLLTSDSVLITSLRLIIKKRCVSDSRRDAENF